MAKLANFRHFHSTRCAGIDPDPPAPARHAGTNKKGAFFMAKSKEAKPGQSDIEEGEIELLNVPRKSDLDNLIDDYKREAEQYDTTPNMTIYKYENDKTGTQRELMGYFSGEEIPERDIIGKMFGGGRYQISLKRPKGNAKEPEQCTCVIKISHVYDAHKARYDEQMRREEIARINGSAAPAGGPPASPAPGATLGESFMIVKEILSLIMPAIKAQAAPAQTNPAGDLLAQYGVMQNVLKKNLFDTAETYRAFNRRFGIQETLGIDDDQTEPEPEPKEPGFMEYVEKVIKMVEPFFGLIAQKGAAGQTAALAAKAAPQFVELINDPVLCRMIVQYFDKTRGAAASDVALKNLGINRTALFSNPSPVPGSQAARQPHQAAARTPGKPSNGRTTAMATAAAPGAGNRK